MTGPVVGQLTLFAGFMVTRSHIASWLVWLYWLTPLSWAIRTLAHNEFDTPRYDFLIVPSAGAAAVRAGDAYLAQYDMQTERAYKWAGVGYLVRTVMGDGLVDRAVSRIRIDVTVWCGCLVWLLMLLIDVNVWDCC